MPDIVISDTSSLILFQNIGEFDLLQKVYTQILITPEVADEFSEKVPDWIIIKKVQDTKYQKIIETQLDKGEASVIALAKEYNNPLLILDDLKARKLAFKLDIKITGALGVIHKAKQIGKIQLIKPILSKLSESDFRISENIVNELLRLNNE